MKKMFFIIMTVAVAATMNSCGLVSVEPGQEGVFYYRSWFSEGGVDDIPLTQGSAWKVFTTEIIRVSVIPERYEEKIHNLVSRENVPLSFNTNITLRVRPGKSPVLIKNYGQDWYRINLQDYYRNLVRYFACEHSVEELTANRDIIEQINRSVADSLRSYIVGLSEAKPFPVDVMKVVTGSAIPSDALIHEMEATSVQMQRVKTMENQLSVARETIKVKRAEAEALLSYWKTLHVSESAFVRLCEQELIRSKNNVGVVYIAGSSSNTPLLLNLGK